jgi:hypothetical protein
MNGLFAGIYLSDLVIIMLGLVEASYERAQELKFDFASRKSLDEYPGRFAFAQIY